MKVKPKILSITAKCSDLFSGHIIDEDFNVIKEYEGYVPKDLGIGGGDYVEMEIDLQSGQILNWKPIEEIETESED